MSETPRTEKAREQYRMDVYEPNPRGFCVAEPVHASFARSLEREIRQLEVAIYDGKKEAGVLRQMLAEMHEVNSELHKEIAELHKDKERLDWLLDEESGVNLEYVYTDKRGKYVIVWFDDREDIDKAMEEHFATER